MKPSIKRAHLEYPLFDSCRVENIHSDDHYGHQASLHTENHLLL